MKSMELKAVMPLAVGHWKPSGISVKCSKLSHLARIGGVHRVLDYWWKFCQEFTQFTHDFVPDCSCSIFLLVRSFPYRDHIMGINLVQTRAIQLCHLFLQIFSPLSIKRNIFETMSNLDVSNLGDFFKFCGLLIISDGTIKKWTHSNFTFQHC